MAKKFPIDRWYNKKVATFRGALIMVLAGVISGFVIIYADSLIPPQVQIYEKNMYIIGEYNTELGWQTYRNEEYGFEFKYPDNLLTEEKINENDPNQYLIYLYDKIQKNMPYFMLISIKKSSFDSFIKWEDSLGMELPITLVDNINARELPVIGGCVRNLEFYHNSYEYAFSDYVSGCESIDEIHIQDQIISLFKFID